jgi:hypothetical protein
MAAWKKVTLKFKDCGVGGAGQRLNDAFGLLLIADGGRHPSAAIYRQRTQDFEYIYYYFSPDAYLIAPLLAENYGATPCERPERPSLDLDGVHLAVGDSGRALELLWPEKSRGGSQ